MRKENPANPDGTLKPYVTRCPRHECKMASNKGVLMPIVEQPKMAHAFGIEHVQCDKCGNKYARRLK